MSFQTQISPPLSRPPRLRLDKMPAEDSTTVGYCECASCRRDDLDRNQMVAMGHPNAPDAAEYFERFGGTICWDCYEYTDPLPKTTIPAGYVPCNECEVGTRGVRVKDETTGGYVTDWCPRCSGDGRVRIAQ